MLAVTGYDFQTNGPPAATLNATTSAPCSKARRTAMCTSISCGAWHCDNLSGERMPINKLSEPSGGWMYQDPYQKAF